LLLPLIAHADDLIVTNESPAFALDTRLPAGDAGPGSLIVQSESAPFTLDTRLPSGDSPGGSLIVQAETPPFTLDTRLPDGIVPSSGTVVTESGAFVLDTRMPDGIVPASGTAIAESGSFTLDTRLPDGVAPQGSFVVAASPPFTLDTRLQDGVSFTNAVVSAESPPFTLDTRLPADTTPAPNLVAQTESPPFTLDTRLPSDTTPSPNFIAQSESPAFTLDTRMPAPHAFPNLFATAESGPFTLDTLSGWLSVPTQTLSGGGTGGKARFAPDGIRLAKTDGNRVLLWNLQSFRSNAVFSGHWGDLTSVEFAPLGDQILTGSADGTVRWWDAATRTELGRIDAPGAGTVYAAWASDGARVLVGRGANVTLYRAPSMEPMRAFPGTEGSVSAVALCPEGLALAGNSDRFAVIWDTATGAVVSRLTQHTRLITAAAFFPGGTNAMTAALDGTIRVWDTGTGEERLVLQQGSPVVDAFLSADGQVLVSCYDGNPLFRGNGPIGTAYIWDAQSGALMRVLSDETAPAQMRGVAISPDHTALAATYSDGSVRLWDTGLDPRPIHPVTPLPIASSVPVTLRSHGLYYFALDAEAGRSLVVTLDADPGGGGRPAWGADIPVRSARGLSPDAEFANLGAPATRERVGLADLRTPPPGADITASRMTATRGRLPSVYDYETFAQASVTNLHCELPLATSTSEKVYVLVFAPYLSAGSIAVSLHAGYSDFSVTSVWPSSGGNSGTVTTEIRGTGFGSDTAALLLSSRGEVVRGASYWYGDSTELRAVFELSGVTPGSYDLVIEDAGGTRAFLRGSFDVLPGGQRDIGLQFLGPSSVRFGRTNQVTLLVRNKGLMDAENTLVEVRIDARGGSEQANLLWATGHGRYARPASPADSSQPLFLIPLLPPGTEATMTLPLPAGLPVACYRVSATAKAGAEADECEGLARALKRLWKEWDRDRRDLEARIGEAKCDCKWPTSGKCRVLCSQWPDIWKRRDDLCRACRGFEQMCGYTLDDCQRCGQGQFQLAGSKGDAAWGIASLLKPPSLGEVCVVGPIDPNDKIGPGGIGPNRVVSAQDELEYMIRFENVASASAPVQELVVVDYLDAGLDWTTVRFKELAYGDRIVTQPAGGQSFTVRDQPPANSSSIIGAAVGSMVIEVRGTANPQSGRIEWRVSCLDTNTGFWPQDALSGFLPPENGTGRGQGHVKFGVRPRGNLPLGTAITNVATIVFDNNDPIATPSVWNIVGDVPSLAATLAYAPGPVTAGMPFTYTIGLTNTGTNLVRNVVLTNALPAGVTVLAATATLGAVTVTNGTVIWSLGTVTNGAGGRLTVTVLPSQ
jgi:uncharacterized repeat protein (TIGR01451 family)